MSCRRYVVSASAINDAKVHCTCFFVEAADEEEGFAKGLRVARKVWPKPDGFFDHDISLLDADAEAVDPDVACPEDLY